MLRKGEGFSPGFQRLGKAQCLPQSDCAWQDNTKGKRDIRLLSIFTAKSLLFENTLQRPLWVATMLIQPHWIKTQKKMTCTGQLWFQRTSGHTFSLCLGPIRICRAQACVEAVPSDETEQTPNEFVPAYTSSSNRQKHPGKTTDFICHQKYRYNPTWEVTWEVPGHCLHTCRNKGHTCWLGACEGRISLLKTQAAVLVGRKTQQEKSCADPCAGKAVRKLLL